MNSGQSWQVMVVPALIGTLNIYMPFTVLHTAVKVRPIRMTILAGKAVESADTPAKREDYLTRKGLRLVGKGSIEAQGSSIVTDTWHDARHGAGQTLLFRLSLLCEETVVGDEHHRRVF